jgi:hypothetical protein
MICVIVKAPPARSRFLHHDQVCSNVAPPCDNGWLSTQSIRTPILETRAGDAMGPRAHTTHLSYNLFNWELLTNVNIGSSGLKVRM